ncbi:MAG: nickel pincer cofactor biosynthesis protein LarB [bacterium]
MEKIIASVLSDFKKGKKGTQQVLKAFKELSFEEMGFAKIDHHRIIRKGFPEIIYCEGKRPEQIVSICKAIIAKKSILLGTRLSEAVYKKIKHKLKGVKYHPLARIITCTPGGASLKKRKGKVMIICAGTADIPVAEEAAVTAEIMGNPIKRIYDVGVAGIHRLLAHQKDIGSASVIIVIAGMEGALLSVVGGMVSVPVIGVPTSVGYGTCFKGLTPLLAMLNSCASGTTVVNIDNGFGAAYAATLMNKD